MNQKPHDFKQKLAWSQQASDEPFWNAVYRKAFPDMVNHIVSQGNTWAQHLGIDRYITLKNGQVLRVDEKKRNAVYRDVLLEFLSNDRAGTPGWMEKPLSIDYLAYAFMPTRQVYLFPWQPLRRAWLENKDKWLKTCRIVKAQNEGYWTHSVAVPIIRLQIAVKNAAIVTLDAGEIQQPLAAAA